MANLYELQKRITELENENAELNKKLDDVYSIDEHNKSMAHERLIANLEKDFAFLYEDFQEYANSEVSADNYLTLQVIIKKMFRALNRNGIHFE